MSNDGFTFRSNGKGDRGDMLQHALNDNTLTVTKAATKNVIVFRPFPAIDASGNAVPMTLGQGAQGLIFSRAAHEEELIVYGGMQGGKFTGSIRCSDRPDARTVDTPWGGLYIRLKGAFKKNRLSAGAMGSVPLLLAADPHGKAQIPRAEDYVFLQGVFLSIDGVPQPLQPFRCLALGPSGVKSLRKLMNESAQAGVDLFHPETGFTLTISGEKPDPDRPAFLKVERGAPLPLSGMPPGFDWRAMIRPWDQVFKYTTFDQHMRKLLECFPEAAVAEAFPAEAERVLGRRPYTYSQAQYGTGGAPPAYQPTQPQQQPAGYAPQQPGYPPQQPGYAPQPGYQQPAPAQPAWQPAPAAPAPAQWGSAPQGQPAPAAPAPAPGQWAGAPAPAAPAQPAWQNPAPQVPAAPAQPAWQSAPAPAPAAPAQQAWQNPAPAAPAPAAAPAPGQWAQAPAAAPAWNQPAPAAPATAAGPAFALPDPTKLASQYEQMLGASQPPRT